MNFLNSALALSRRGFHVFPLHPNSKLPLLTDFPNKATRDEELIKKWWGRTNRNIGISTTHFGDDEALIAVDVDVKKGGRETFEKLKKEKDFPETFTQVTTTKGLHLVYRSKIAVKQGTDVLGPGMDIRSRGGYLVGTGSVLNGIMYLGDEHEVVMSPEWLELECGEAREKILTHVPGTPDRDMALARAREYLLAAPRAVEGEGGDLLTYKVAAELKDLGCGSDDVYWLMLNGWNNECRPPWDGSILREKINHAFKYGTSPVGIGAPEAVFQALDELPEEETKKEEVLSPIETLNKRYAFVIHRGEARIMDEGHESPEWLKVPSFKLNLRSKKICIGDKISQLADVWLDSPNRRSYEGVRFDLSKKPNPRYFNFWRGFTVELPTGQEPEIAHVALKFFKEHVLENIAGGNEDYALWITGWFAHLIQHPEEKPRTAMVLKGSKGVGKNAFVDCVGTLLGPHAMTASNRRYLTGNFNSHLETTLLFTLDEAFWSGDKQTEGILKDLVTGHSHNIERKGFEPYQAKNYSRVVILGNDDWLVPASQDERRYAVFNVGEGRKQDREFFRMMSKGMEAGGSRLLLKYLMEFDLSQVDVDAAPQTEGLAEQKINSLSPLEQWLYDSISNGEFRNATVKSGWPNEISKDILRNAFREYVQERKIHSRIPNDSHFSRQIKKLTGITGQQKSYGLGDRNIFAVPELERCREIWDCHMGHATKWGEE